MKRPMSVAIMLVSLLPLLVSLAIAGDEAASCTQKITAGKEHEPFIRQAFDPAISAGKKEITPSAPSWSIKAGLF